MQKFWDKQYTTFYIIHPKFTTLQLDAILHLLSFAIQYFQISIMLNCKTCHILSSCIISKIEVLNLF